MSSESTDGIAGQRYSRETGDRLQLLLDLPQDSSLRLPVVERIAQLRKLAGKEVRDLGVRDHIPEQPWDLTLWSDRGLLSGNAQPNFLTYLIVVLLFHSIKRINDELRICVRTVVRHEEVLDRQAAIQHIS